MRKMNLVKKCGWFLGCFLAVATMSACSDDENKIDDFIPGEGFTESMTVLPEKGSQVMKFTANDAWSAKSNQTWLKLDGQAQSSGKMGAAEMYVSYEVNEMPADRTADITLSVGSTIKTIKVTQKAAGRVISFDGVAGDTLKLQKDFTTGDAAILANVTWEFVADSLSATDKGWIEVTPQDGKVAIKVLNHDGSARCARLVFRDKNYTSFTKALFVAIGGWGENYLTWTIEKKMFVQTEETVDISATFVEDLAPRALEIKGDDTTATSPSWIQIAEKPTAKSIVKQKIWSMTVNAHTEIADRMALIVMAPVEATNEEVLENLKNYKSEKISQTNENPVLQFGLWVYTNDYAYVGVLDEYVFKMGLESKLALQIFTNGEVRNLRAVVLKNGVEGPQSTDKTIQNLKFRGGETIGVHNSIIDADVQGAAFGDASTEYIAVDMYKNDTFVKKAYFKVSKKLPF